MRDDIDCEIRTEAQRLRFHAERKLRHASAIILVAVLLVAFFVWLR